MTRYLLSCFFLFTNVSIKSQNVNECIIEKGLQYISVKTFGAVGDGIANDRFAIQKAFNSGKNIYFPNGIYSLKDKTNAEAFILIDKDIHSKHIFFKDKAWLFVDANADSDYIKPAVLFVSGRKNEISPIEISGLKIDGNKQNNNLRVNGLVAFSELCLVKFISIKNAIIKNCGGEALHFECLNTKLNNIITINNDGHDIAINNNYNYGYKFKFELDGLISKNCGAYSIDFGGPDDTSDIQKTINACKFIGVVKNVKSTNSFYGIKTAGYWDLDMYNVSVKNSYGNGFYWSKATPGATVIITKLNIENVIATGLYLSGSGNFKGKEITIKNSTILFSIVSTDVEVDGLILKAGTNYLAGLRLGKGDFRLNNFAIDISENEKEYPIWVSGNTVKFSNGIIKANGLYAMILKQTKKTIDLQNVKFIGDMKASKKMGGIIIAEQIGKLNIKGCNLTTLVGNKIENRTQAIVNISK